MYQWQPKRGLFTVAMLGRGWVSPSLSLWQSYELHLKRGRIGVCGRKFAQLSSPGQDYPCAALALLWLCKSSFCKMTASLKQALPSWRVVLIWGWFVMPGFLPTFCNPRCRAMIQLCSFSSDRAWDKLDRHLCTLGLAVQPVQVSMGPKVRETDTY